MKLKKTPRISDPRNQTTIDLSTITNSPTCKNEHKTGNLTKIHGPLHCGPPLMDHNFVATVWLFFVKISFQIQIISIVWRCVFEFLFWFAVSLSCALSSSSPFWKSISIICIKIGNYFIKYARPFSLEDNCINKFFELNLIDSLAKIVTINQFLNISYLRNPFFKYFPHIF